MFKAMPYANELMTTQLTGREIEEVLDVADRILVMHDGRVTAEIKPDEVDLEQLLAMVMEETKS